jgi:hypothetical protein
MPLSDGNVVRVETARPTTWRADRRESREVESFIVGEACIFLSVSDVLEVVDDGGEVEVMAG